jgi:hypothetical protein
VEHFVTIFDSAFLPQGLALFFSLKKNCDCKLWVICVDRESYDILEKLNLDGLMPLFLADFETEELKTIKGSRSRGEYCWTLTPFAPRFVFQADERVTRVTYVDADLFFLRDPRIIFSEFEESGKSILITEHAYAPEYDLSETSGIYCVQFIIYKKEGSEIARKWWEDKCIEWCYARYEDDKFGDQKYLDKWPVLFDNDVHVMKNKHLALAPWNASIYSYTNAIFYHFQELRIVSLNKVNFGLHRSEYYVPKIVLDKIYKPYLLSLRQASNLLLDAGFKPIFQRKYINILEVLKSILRSIRLIFLGLNTFHERNF